MTKAKQTRFDARRAEPMKNNNDTEQLRTYPPFGYMFNGGEGIPIDDEEAILQLCTSLSDDPDFLEKKSDDTHAGRLNFLRDNGFRFERDTLTEKEGDYEMKQLNSHQFEEVYKWLGINLDDLGCVMLNLEPIENEFNNLPLHHSGNKDRFWIDGWVAEKASHITLLYGLLENGHNYEMHIEKVLDGWKMDQIEIADIGYFNSPYEDEKYFCIVAHIKPTPKLLEGHQRLEFIPHINTFTGYKPHLTLCYIEPDESVRDKLISQLKDRLVGKKIGVKKLNLGDK